MQKSYQERVEALQNDYVDWFKDEKRLSDGRMTSELYPYKKMFSPIRINKLTVKNRIVMAPMGNIQMAEETGRPNQKMLAYFVERAKGGAGLLTSGLVPISFGIDNSIMEMDKLTYFPRIDRSRTVFSGWRDLAEGVHSFGAAFFIQLTPGLGRVGNPQCLVNSLKFPVSASWNPNFYIPAIPCKPLTDGKCKRIIKNAGQAAADAKASLIDGVYLHGHEGYLLEQMTNPAFNRRRVGRYADWQAFGLDMVKEMRRRVGPDYPIMYRIDLSLMLNATYGGRMETVGSLRRFKKERTVDMTLDYMKNLVAAGVDIFDVDLGCYDNWWLPHPPGPMPAGCFLEVSRIVKEYFEENKILSNAGLPVPIVGVGKLGYPDFAERALREEKCDMVMLGRPLLADPYWPDKAYSGRVSEIRACIGCQEGCINEFVEGGHPQCAVNPRSSFEDIFPAEPRGAAEAKKVAVVGAGPAGIVCAVTAAKRGHKVTLYEKRSAIGGLLRPGSAAHIKFEIKNYLSYLETMLQNAIDDYGLDFLPDTEAKAPELAAEGYDVIVTAVGARQQKPPIPGIEGGDVVLGTELLQHPEWAEDKKDIIVVGGGVVGCETAFWLHYELGKSVRVIEMTPYFMNHVCTANRGYLIHYLEKGGVELLNCTKLKSVEPNGVTVVRNVSPTVPDPYVTWQPILPENIENPLAKKLETESREEKYVADLVVIAAGGKPDDSLYYTLLAENAAPRVFNIGDSQRQAKVFEAVKTAYHLGLEI